MVSFIKLCRDILNWEWYQDSVPFRLYIHLLLRANYTTKKWQGTLVQRGQLITSTDHLAHDLNLSIQQIRTGIEKLKASGYITVVTTNKFSLVTVVDYEKTQGRQSSINNPNNNHITNQQQSANKQITTTKEGKNIKEKNKETIEERKQNFKNDVFKHSQYSNKILNDFFNYWSQINPRTFEMKWEDSNYFEVNNRLNSWKSKEDTWRQKNNKSDFIPSHNR
jgi:biotin operon repressor